MSQSTDLPVSRTVADVLADYHRQIAELDQQLADLMCRRKWLKLQLAAFDDGHAGGDLATGLYHLCARARSCDPGARAVAQELVRALTAAAEPIPDCLKEYA